MWALWGPWLRRPLRSSHRGKWPGPSPPEQRPLDVGRPGKEGTPGQSVLGLGPAGISVGPVPATLPQHRPGQLPCGHRRPSRTLFLWEHLLVPRASETPPAALSVQISGRELTC